MRREKSKMLAGELYTADCPELAADNACAHAWMSRYNASLATSPEERHVMLAELLASVGEGAAIRPPFHCDYGYNITLGDKAFLNFNCIILDVVEVVIGDGAKIDPASRSSRRTTRAMPDSAGPASNAAGRSASGAMYGSALAPSSCRG